MIMSSPVEVMTRKIDRHARKGNWHQHHWVWIPADAKFPFLTYLSFDQVVTSTRREMVSTDPSILRTADIATNFLHISHAAAFTVVLELQGDCSDQLTLICRHDTVRIDPNWIHNGTVEAGQLLATAFPGLMRYSFQNSTEHRVTVTGGDDVTALDGYVFQCVYSIQGSLIKSNAVQYSFVPNGQLQYTISLII